MGNQPSRRRKVTPRRVERSAERETQPTAKPDEEPASLEIGGVDIPDLVKKVTGGDAGDLIEKVTGGDAGDLVKKVTGAGAEDVGMPGTAAEAPKKSSIGTIVVLAVLVIGCIGAFLAMRSCGGTSDGDTPKGTMTTEARLIEWRDWSPRLSAQVSLANTSESAIARQLAGLAAPGVAVLEARVVPGYYDDDDETYHGDLYYILAESPEGNRFALQCYAQSEVMARNDVELDPETFGEEARLTTLPNGTEVALGTFHDPSQLPYASPEWEDLIHQTSEDWSGSVVSWVNPVNSSGTEVEVFVTTWRAFTIDGTSPGLWAVYELDDTWELTGWEWAEASQ